MTDAIWQPYKAAHSLSSLNLRSTKFEQDKICVDKCETKCEIVYQSQMRFIECEIAYQSKIGFECVIACQFYCVDKCETECEIAYQSKIGLNV